MFERFKQYLNSLFKRRAEKKQIHVREFRRISRELIYLSEIAARLNPEQNQTMDRLNRIRVEMDRLNKLVESRDFHKIPAHTKMELRQSLLVSREQLVETIHHAPAPTNTLQ